MKWKKLIFVAFKSIIKNRMRSLLTMLGIIIGVGAVITLVSVGEGASAEIESEMSSLGTNLLIVRSGTGRLGGVSKGAASLDSLTRDDVTALRQKGTLLSDISPVINAPGQVVAEGKNWSTTVNGVSPEYLAVRAWGLESGIFFTEREVRSRKKVCVLGKTVADELFGDKDPLGHQIRIRRIPFKIIGVLEEKGQNMVGMDEDDVILAPSDTVLYRMGNGRNVSAIMASAISDEQMEAASQQISSILRKQHRLKAVDSDDFSVRSLTDIINTASSVTGILTILLATIAAVSLLVGGIGIMNIMLVSVTERTREIGIRLAIGAKGRDILSQFLIEAVILSILGGLIGIASGLLLADLAGKLIGMGVSFNPLIIAISFVFSGAVGVFFGFYPALKASRLNPIDALHYE